jgi:hypothetical protein
VLVPDTVAGISFQKYFAASTLDHEGKTDYFISDETRREFVKQHGLTTRATTAGAPPRIHGRPAPGRRVAAPLHPTADESSSRRGRRSSG